jgi:hypothetical protein
MQCDSPVALLCGGRGTHVSVHRDRTEVTKAAVSRTQLESWATEGKSPLGENRSHFRLVFPSITEDIPCESARTTS